MRQSFDCICKCLINGVKWHDVVFVLKSVIFGFVVGRANMAKEKSSVPGGLGQIKSRQPRLLHKEYIISSSLDLFLFPFRLRGLRAKKIHFPRCFPGEVSGLGGQTGSAMNNTARKGKGNSSRWRGQRLGLQLEHTPSMKPQHPCRKCSARHLRLLLEFSNSVGVWPKYGRLRAALRLDELRFSASAPGLTGSPCP